MKHFYALMLLLAVCSVKPTYAQICTDKGFRLVIVGTSTAAGWTGPSTIDSSFGRRLKRYLEAIQPDWRVYNIASSGITSYSICPTWYIPPVIPGDSRPSPDPVVNITRAITEYSPDAILINIPSNDAASGYTLQEQKDNFNRIVASADSLNIAVWVTSTQPRDQMWGSPRQPLMDMRDWLATRFGDKYIDFWTGFANTDGTIVSTYAYGDGIHLNDAAHRIMFERIQAEGIPDTLCKGPIKLQQLNVTAAGSGRQLSWTTSAERLMSKYAIQRSLDSLAWDSIGVVTAGGSNIALRNYSFTDNSTQTTAVYYRLKLRDSRNRVFYSRAVKYNAIPDPYALSSFTGTAFLNTVQLNWITTRETKLDSFKVQRKTAAAAWQTPGGVKATGVLSYAYTDTLTTDSTYFYRLHITDSTGRQFFTDSIKVTADSGYWKPFAVQGFSVTGNTNAARLQWQTIKEKYTLSFIVQRSDSSAAWTALGTLAAAGRSMALVSYSYTDSARFNYDVFYRLRMTDSLGRDYYTDSIKLKKPQPAFVLDSFSVKADWDQRLLVWRTVSEYQASQFTIEKSVDSLTWTIIGLVNAKGNADTPNYYRFTDMPAPQQVLYYRLHMQGLYSSVVRVAPDSSYAQPFIFTQPVISRQNSLPYLQWTTVSEKNTLAFSIERKLTAGSWTTIGTVNAAGNSNTLCNYSFTDNSGVNEDAYFRLRMEDTSHRYFYSDSVFIAKLQLPFVLNSFTVAADYHLRKLNWQTASESRSLHFIIERSADSVAWLAVDTVAAAGISAITLNYAFTDQPTATATWYYRLHMEDSAGVHTYTAGLKVLPDPLYAQPFTYTGPTVTKQSNQPYVQWTTTREKNTLLFTVERSLNNTSWTTAGTVAAAGNSTTVRNYSYTDNLTPTQDLWYRIKMEDTLHRIFYSTSVKLTFATGPFALTSFTAVPDYDDTYLSWQTASETSTSKFVVQRSADSTVWDIIDFVTAAGTSTTVRNYTFVNTRVPAINFYYRLKMETTNGSATYSPVVKTQPDSVLLNAIRLKSFTASLVANKPFIQWTTYIEKKSSKMMVQRSTNGWQWTTVSTQNAAGRSLTETAYSYTDNYTLTGVTYYRIRLEDSVARAFNSAQISISPGQGARIAYTAPVLNEAPAEIILAPNPVESTFRIKGLAAGEHTVVVYDGVGRQVMLLRNYQSGAQIDARRWSSGWYYVLVDDGLRRLRLLKQ